MHGCCQESLEPQELGSQANGAFKEVGESFPKHVLQNDVFQIVSMCLVSPHEKQFCDPIFHVQ